MESSRRRRRACVGVMRRPRSVTIWSSLEGALPKIMAEHTTPSIILTISFGDAQKECFADQSSLYQHDSKIHILRERSSAPSSLPWAYIHLPITLIILFALLSSHSIVPLRFVARLRPIAMPGTRGSCSLPLHPGSPPAKSHPHPTPCLVPTP